jgi:hypothetical protein
MMFATERIDAWVFKVGIAVPVVCIAGLGLWHLVAYLVGKLPKKPRRQSPEPAAAIPSSNLRAPEGADPTRDDAERLQQACSALEDSLAEKYMELAENWLRSGQFQKAAITWKKVIQACPETRQAQLARDRLQQIGNELEGS